jgi:hypothetical protein
MCSHRKCVSGQSDQNLSGLTASICSYMLIILLPILCGGFVAG